MANHDRYDTDILRALQRIANSLERIEKKIESPTMNLEKLEEENKLLRVEELYTNALNSMQRYVGQGGPDDRTIQEQRKGTQMQKVICDICEKKYADKRFKVKKEIETANFDMGFVFPKREWVHIDICEDCYEKLFNINKEVENE